MTAEILAVGTELLLGDITNTNAQYIARELASLGISVLHQSVVGDNPERLTASIKTALSRSDILITTGGLGPTGDDITRETVAESLNLRLRLDENSIARMETFFKRIGAEMVETNRKQAMMPEGAIIFDNEFGTAPGCAVENHGRIVIMLPGPPREMAPMFENSVKPFLARFSNAIIKSINLRVFGTGESVLQAMLDDLMRGENPTLSPYAKDGEVLLRVTARAADEKTALALCRPLVDEVKKRTGDNCYGEDVDSLQQAVVDKLRQLGQKVAAAESCTGGLFCKRITEIPGSSEVFDCGVVSYANSIKTSLLGVGASTLENFGAVSRETACEMAEGVRRLAGADIGVGITGIVGPGGGTPEKPVGLVFAAVSDGTSCVVRRLVLGHGAGERELIRYLAASNALDMVRRHIFDLPQKADAEQVPVASNDIP
jgi:nicotinamide-nucleotide amidase